MYTVIFCVTKINFYNKNHTNKILDVYVEQKNGSQNQADNNNNKGDKNDNRRKHMMICLLSSVQQ
jgi:hypothetical protein